MVRTAEPDIQDVTPTEDAPLPAPVPVAVKNDLEITEDWRPEPGVVFAGNDLSLRAILGRSYQNAERGLAGYDPVTRSHVWWKSNGRGGHTPVVRPVAEDLETAQKTGADFWSYERNCWVWGGVKAASDPFSASSEHME